MYGPHYPLHNERYFKSKVLPKLIDERTQMFRFYSCKFRIEKSKVKTARVVMFKEFGIMTCFTLEASFHGFIDTDRTTTEFTTESLQELGSVLGASISDYVNLFDAEERQKAQLREALKQRKKKLKARDITKAINNTANGNSAKANGGGSLHRGESVTSEPATGLSLNQQQVSGSDTDQQVTAEGELVNQVGGALRLNRP